MAWNSRDDDLASPEARVQVDISGFPSGVRRVLLRHYRIDDPQQFLDGVEKMGSPDQPWLEQYAALEARRKEK
jgi:xylan 1,4-beta-xylosidase